MDSPASAVSASRPAAKLNLTISTDHEQNPDPSEYIAELPINDQNKVSIPLVVEQGEHLQELDDFESLRDAVV